VEGYNINQGFPTCGPWANSGPPSLKKWPLISKKLKLKNMRKTRCSKGEIRLCYLCLFLL